MVALNPKPVKDVYLSLEKPLQDTIELEGGLELYLAADWKPEWNATVEGVVSELPVKGTPINIKKGDKVIFSYHIVASRDFKAEQNAFYPIVNADLYQHFKSGQGWTFFARAVQGKIARKWVGYVLDEYGELITGVDGSEHEFNRWKSQFTFSDVQHFTFRNLLQLDRDKQYWICPTNEIFAKIENDVIVSVSDRLILEPIDVEVPEETLKAMNIELPPSAVQARYYDRAKVVSGGERLGIKKGDIVAFEQKFLEKYTILKKPYFLIRERRVLGIWQNLN